MRHILLVIVLSVVVNSSYTVAQKRSSIEGKKIVSLELVHDSQIPIQPEASIPIGVRANVAKNDPLLTVGFLQGKISWDNYIVHVTGGSFSNGLVNINTDHRTFKNHNVVIRIINKFDSANSVQETWRVDYDKNYILDFNGKRGLNGDDGAHGQIGHSPTEARSGDGKNGADGINGRPGRNGGNGGNAPNLKIFVTTFVDAELNEKMLWVKIINLSDPDTTYYTAYAGRDTFKIAANGGVGGNGGNGGNAGNGGSGGVGGYASNSSNNNDPNSPQPQQTFAGKGGEGGNGGNGGDSGTGGNGGNGGMVELIVDPAAKEFLSTLQISNGSGVAGVAGLPGRRGEAGKGAEGGSGKGLPGIAGVNGGYGPNGVAGKDGPALIISFEPVEMR